jgi:hypothetical protein
MNQKMIKIAHHSHSQVPKIVLAPKADNLK